MNSNVIGYNSNEVRELREKINNSAKQVAQKIIERLHSEIIVPMSKAWYAPEAVEFFNGFGKVVAQSSETITEAFQSFNRAVNEAANNWAENTGGQAPTLASIEPVDMTLSVGEIQDNYNGNVMIDESQAQTVANNLGQVEEEIKSDLKSISDQLSADAAFLGDGQSEAVVQCFISVNIQVGLIFKFLSNNGNGSETSLQYQINKAVTKYKEVAAGIKTAFNNNTTN